MHRPSQATIDEVKRNFPNWHELAVYRHARDLEVLRARTQRAPIIHTSTNK